MLEVEGLAVAYDGGGSALSEVDLSVHEGELVTVLGSNGAGKTTLLRAISKTVAMYGGRALVGSFRWQGKNATSWSSTKMVRHGLVQCPEGRGIFANLSVHENLRAGAFTASRRDFSRRATRCYDTFPDLVPFRSTAAGLLSGGQQQMLAVARALMVEPKLLMLDEPSLGLAPKMIERMGSVISDLRAGGTSILLVEQNAAMALSIADRAYVLEVGRVVTAGPAGEIARSGSIARSYLGLEDELGDDSTATGMTT